MRLVETTQLRPSRTNAKMARSLLTDSEAFVLAAELLNRSQKTEVIGPKYYLACHAIELILKSFILTNGGKQGELKDIGHDLNKAWARAIALGLSPTDERTEAVISMLAPHHLDHRFRYRQTGYITVPEYPELCDVIKNLISHVGPDVDTALKAESRAKQR